MGMRRRANLLHWPLCALSMLLLCMSWVQCEELFVWTEGCPVHYALLLLMAIMPGVLTWHETVSFNGSESKPGLPCKFHHHLESYL